MNEKQRYLPRFFGKTNIFAEIFLEIGQLHLKSVTSMTRDLRHQKRLRDTMRVSLSPIIPRWESLIAAKQAHGSH